MRAAGEGHGGVHVRMWPGYSEWTLQNGMGFAHMQMTGVHHHCPRDDATLRPGLADWVKME